MSKNRDKELIIVFGAGLIGVGIGMLFATQKGSVTRERLKVGLNDTIFKLKDTLERVTDNAVDKLSQQKNNTEGTYDDLQPNMTYKTEDLILFL